MSATNGSNGRLPREAGAAGEPVQFTFDGRKLTGYAGEPIAAALHANGVTVLSRSFKYRRPRGLHCMAGSCPNCSMRVDGLPGVVTCVEPLRGGEQVERERGWPTADRDALGVLDLLSPLTPNGFQYRWFRKQPRLFDATEPVLRRLAARAALPDTGAAARVYGTGPLPAGAEPRRTVVDVAVIGGGVAGIRAALAAAQAGASVALIDRDTALGGGAADDPRREAEVAQLVGQVGATAGVETHSGATAFGWYERELMLVSDRDGVQELHAGRWVICTGGYPQPLAFPGNDLPGVMLGQAVRRLVRYGVRPGQQMVIVTDNDAGLELADDLRARSITVAAVADTRPGDGAAAPIRAAAGHTVLSARGRGRLTGVTLGPVGVIEGSDVECDVLCIDVAPRPANELVLQLLADGSITLERPPSEALRATGAEPVQVTEGVWVAGGVSGSVSFAEAGEQGELAGRAAAA
jgi:sarcosine oxidase subunit alpha